MKKTCQLKEGVVKRFRMKRCLTQKQLAERSGCHESTISQIERRNVATSASAERIRKVLGIQRSSFYLNPESVPKKQAKKIKPEKDRNYDIAIAKRAAGDYKMLIGGWKSASEAINAAYDHIDELVNILGFVEEFIQWLEDSGISIDDFLQERNIISEVYWIKEIERKREQFLRGEINE